MRENYAAVTVQHAYIESIMLATLKASHAKDNALYLIAVYTKYPFVKYIRSKK